LQKLEKEKQSEIEGLQGRMLEAEGDIANAREEKRKVAVSMKEVMF
jgi:hypothetical protein